MAIAMRFTPKSMSDVQYAECMKRLEQAGADAPDGRLYHICYGNGNELQILDVWESPERSAEFGQTLMPILQELGIDPGVPEVSEVRSIISG